MHSIGKMARLIKRGSLPGETAPQKEVTVSDLHVAIIMDGNGRWATQRNLPRLVGHRAGSQNARAIVEHASSLGVGYLTLFVFSTENWSRPDDEVTGLMELCREIFTTYSNELAASKMRVRVIGRRQGLPEDIQRLICEAVEKTRHASGMVLTFAINYGGRAEIVDCVRSVASDVAAGRLDPGGIDERTVSERLYTAGMPDPDLIIRTSGELRLSNFLLWQGAYTEIVSVETLWPDFGPKDFDMALAAYAKRQRRYGGIGGPNGGE